MKRLVLVLLLVLSLSASGASAASKVKPSPSPKWPPVGFTVKGEIYAKVPTVKELVGIASNSKVLTAQLAQKVDDVLICQKYSCGAITVASTNGCSWWEVKSKVIGPKNLEDKTITLEDVRIIHKSDRVPPPPLAYSKLIPKKDRKKIKISCSSKTYK